MITSGRLKELLNRRPFRPFRLFLSDGSKHEVPHPEFAWVFGGRVFIGIPGKGNLEADGAIKEIAILHVTRIEEVARGKARRRVR